MAFVCQPVRGHTSSHRQRRGKSRVQPATVCMSASPGRNHQQQDAGVLPFAEHMLELEALLPTMTCSQLAATGTSVHQTYRAALLFSQAGSSADTVNQQLLDYFTSQLPHQSWLLTYRSAVEKVLMPQHKTHSSTRDSERGRATGGGTRGNADTEDGSSSSSSSAKNQCSSGHNCTPQHLADILATVAGLPIQVVQPLPIGFGTPRWSRPLAAADPTAWEQWLAQLTLAYAELLASQQHQQHQQQQQPAQHLLEQLSDYVISLACSMRWVNVNVDDDVLQTPEFKDKVVKCLKQQQEQEVGIEQPDVVQQQHQPWQQQQQQNAGVPFALSGSLAHRVTYTSLLLLLPPPRPLLAAFFDATQPAQFSLAELQAIVRGLLFVGTAPSEAWLRSLVDLVRNRATELSQQDVLSFVEGFRFFSTQARRPAWLRDVTALLEEFSCVG